jgi:hypothetical protein
VAPVPPPAAVRPPRGSQPDFADLRVPDEPEPPRVGRGRALIGALLAVAGVGLAIGALLLLRGGDNGTPTVALPTSTPSVTAAPTTTPTATPTTTPTSSAPTVEPTTAAPTVAAAPILPIDVLNNSRIHRLAADAAARFRAAGWPTPVVDNYSGSTLAQTTVFYAPGQRASAERFARQFKISRVVPRINGLPGHGLVVVLTRDFA